MPILRCSTKYSCLFLSFPLLAVVLLAVVLLALSDSDHYRFSTEYSTDGKTWERNLIHAGLGSCISLWVSGLPEQAARDRISVWLDGDDLPALFVSKPGAQGLRQINAMLPSGAQPGACAVAVAFHDSVSEAVPVKLV